MAAAKAARRNRNTTVRMHDFYLPNDPFQDPYVGRRTGVPLNIRARKDSNGFDNIDDYFPDSEPEEENIVPNEQNSERELLVGRRTGIPLNINPRRDSKGFESVDDYFPDSVHDDQVEDIPEDASKNPDEQEAPETPEEQVESPNETGTIIKNPGSREPTPQINGTIKKRLSFAHGKSPTESEPSNRAQPRILQDGTKSITEKDDESDSEIIDVVDVDDNSQPDHQESCNVQPSKAFKAEEKGGNQKTTTTKQMKNQRTMSIEDDEIIDVDGIDDEETFLTIGNTTRNANKSIAVDKSPISAEAESFVMSESFVLEGTKHKTMSPEYGSCSDSQPEPSDLPAPTYKKSKIPVRKEGVRIDTKQKANRGRKKRMEDLQDLEQGAEDVETEDGGGERLLDSKQEETTRGAVRGRTLIRERSSRGRQKKAPEVDLDNKSNEIESDVEVEEESKFLRKKAQNTNRRSTRGRQKNVEDSQNVEREADEAQARENDYVEGDVEVGEGLSNFNKDQKQSIGEEELVDSETVEARINEVEKKGKRRAKSLPVTTKQQPQKSTRKVKKSDENAVVASDEELLRGGKKDDMDNGQTGKRGRGRKSVPSIRQQEMKVSRGRKQNSGEILECDDGDSEDGNGREGATGPKAQRRQQEKKAEKGRKKGSEGNLECEVDDGDNEVVGPDEGKAVGPLGSTRKGTESKKIQRQGKSVAEVGTEDEDGAAKVSGRKTRAQRKKEAKQSKEDGNGEERQGDVEGYVEDGSADVELSGRKTRGQRQKEVDSKLNREDGDGEEREEETKEAVVESKTEDPVHIDREEMVLENKQKGEEDSNHDVLVEGVKAHELDTTVQRKGRAGKAKDNNELENDGKFGEVANKRRGRKSLRDQKTGLSEGQGWIEEAEVSLKARKEKKGKETTKVSSDGGQKDVLDIVSGLDEEPTLSNKTPQESVSNSSSASSIVSPGSESKKKAGTKRRKQSSLLPPYARRGSKSKNSKIFATVNNHDNTTESELRTDAKKPRLEEEKKKSNIAGETSKKGGAIGSGKDGKAVHTGRKSGGGKKSVAQRDKSKESEVTHDKSVSSAQNNDEDDHADVFGDSNEVNDEGDGNFSVQEAGGVEDRSYEEVLSEGITPTPFLKPAAKSATALKSILKSGGSVGRANPAGRKRQMNADKSHSGGSDADDESVLPAKQPNRKRLSTVSFATFPFVHASPADLTPSAASRHSALAGMPCWSNGSSDLSFTPGSGRTVRSSVGSASSVSGAGDSDIDPDEEVTLINADGQQEGSADEQSTRRSKRTIVPPLQFWKNERIDYERRKSGGWAIKGVLRNPTPTPKTRKKSKPKRPTARQQNRVDAVDSSEEELGNESLEGFQELTNPTSTVFNPETKEEVEMDLFHAPGMLHFTNPSGNPATDDDPLIVHKFISQPLFGGGQVILRPGAEKGRQFVRNDTMVFYVVKGKIMVTIHQSSVVLNTGSTFFVPQGNSYNIKNLKQTDAKLMFVQIKG